MTVKELIEKLNSIENKDLVIHVEDFDENFSKEAYQVTVMTKPYSKKQYVSIE